MKRWDHKLPDIIISLCSSPRVSNWVRLKDTRKTAIEITTMLVSANSVGPPISGATCVCVGCQDADRIFPFLQLLLHHLYCFSEKQRLAEGVQPTTSTNSEKVNNGRQKTELREETEQDLRRREAKSIAAQTNRPLDVAFYVPESPGIHSLSCNKSRANLHRSFTYSNHLNLEGSSDFQEENKKELLLFIAVLWSSRLVGLGWTNHSPLMWADNRSKCTFPGCSAETDAFDETRLDRWQTDGVIDKDTQTERLSISSGLFSNSSKTDLFSEAGFKLKAAVRSLMKVHVWRDTFYTCKHFSFMHQNLLLW